MPIQSKVQTRRHALWRSFATLLVASATIPGVIGFSDQSKAMASQPVAAQPNVVLLLADDLGLQDIDATSSGTSETPSV